MKTKPKTKPKTFAEAAALCNWTPSERRMFKPLHKAKPAGSKADAEAAKQYRLMQARALIEAYQKAAKRGRGSRKPKHKPKRKP